MQLVLLGLIVGIVGFFLWRAFGNQIVPQEIAVEEQTRGFMFLSNGLLFFRKPGGAVQQVQSAHAQESADRMQRIQEKRSWREGTSFGVSAGGRFRDQASAAPPLQMVSAAFDTKGDLLYFQKDKTFGGLFRLESGSGKETRVLVKQGLSLTGLAPNPNGESIAASAEQNNGSANIAMFTAEGDGFKDVTGGDSIDQSPCWIPNAPKRLAFQSTGLARSDGGFVVAQGPSSIQLLNMETGDVSPILDNAEFDFIKPRVDPKGHLLFIRRPYERPSYGAHNVLTDALFFPFRLLRAIFHYLNFFSLMYSRKPLTGASGPEVKADIKEVMLQGRRIDAQKALRSAGLVRGVPSLVPSSWQLISRDENGHEKILAQNVSSYDLTADGTVVYSNGCGVFILDASGQSKLAHRDNVIGELVSAL
jgi:hypothetical protein